MLVSYVFFFFFFQAEDGIRDVAVTGVQTCALPIFGERHRPELGRGGIGIRRARDEQRDGDGCCQLSDGDRKRVVEGKRGDLGGGRIIKKKKKKSIEYRIT